jgi:NAD(P)-dependent dehydrogenase (short-subunit alcohol dehydrogenase family)
LETVSACPWLLYTFELSNSNKKTVISNSNKMESKVWFVTGASKGLGLSLVKKLLNEGYRVAATSRNSSELQKAVGESRDEFLPLTMTLTDEESVGQALQKTVSTFGRVDVIVNNAGYGLLGALEELSDTETRQNFEVNVFGSINVIRKALPYLRAQRSGHIFNLASIGGFTGAFPGFSIYCATKFAVHGFSESLAEEVKPFGINVTVVSPGYFRTNFLEDSSVGVAASPISEYQTVRESQDVHQNSYNGNQNGDPDKAAAVMIALAEQEQPPVQLFLGQDAYDLAHAKIASVQQDMDKMKELATSTGFN